MAFLYILQSISTRRYYLGSTNDLVRRLAEHARAHPAATRGRGPWTLIYSEEFATLAEARRQELEIKRWKSAKLIGELIRGSVG